MIGEEWMEREDAARHLSVKVSKFNKLVRDGVLPKPSYAAGPRSPRWSRKMLDLIMQGEDTSGAAKNAVTTTATTTDEGTRANVEKILAQATRRRRSRRPIH